MRVGQSLTLGGAGMALVGGWSIGVALSLLPGPLHAVLVILFVLGCVGEWCEIKIGPLMTFSLRPVVSFVALWRTGLPGLLVVGLLPLLVVPVVSGRVPLHLVLSLIGGEALALWGGYATHALASRLVSGSGGYPAAALWAQHVAGMAGFWVAWVAVGSLRLGLREGLQARRALLLVARGSWPHACVLTAAALLLGYIESTFGAVVVALATVVLVEAYYPWKLLGEQRDVLLTSLQMMAEAVDLKDPYTSGHSHRVSRYATRLARAMGLPEEEVERIRIGGLMHDIGKIGISGRIIRKPTKLTAEEYALMREHSRVSAGILQPLEVLNESARMVHHHHEHWDGSGYPDGLRGEEIPVGARVILVADAYDALTTDRPYRKGVDRESALAVVKRHSGTQFDPSVVRALEQTYRSL